MKRPTVFLLALLFCTRAFAAMTTTISIGTTSRKIEVTVEGKKAIIKYDENSCSIPTDIICVGSKNFANTAATMLTADTVAVTMYNTMPQLFIDLLNDDTMPTLSEKAVLLVNTLCTGLNLVTGEGRYTDANTTTYLLQGFMCMFLQAFWQSGERFYSE